MQQLRRVFVFHFRREIEKAFNDRDIFLPEVESMTAQSRHCKPQAKSILKPLLFRCLPPSKEC